jgi:ATP-dependent DNA helicase RecQ
MIRHNYNYLLEYIPARYTGLSPKQLQDRNTVYDFKNGNISSSVKNEFLSKVRGIVSGRPSDWVVCFIPASTKSKTYNRYSALALFLSREAGCNVFIDAVTKATDSEAGHVVGKSNNPTEDFEVKSEYLRGKKVILIDDVITRGRTFDDTADLIMRSGAVSVQGLFLAKTIHPNLPQVDKEHSINISQENHNNEDYSNECKVNDNKERNFTEIEKGMVLGAVVVYSESGLNCCFMMKNGHSLYMPMSDDSTAREGDTVDLNTATIVTIKEPGHADRIRVKVIL